MNAIHIGQTVAITRPSHRLAGRKGKVVNQSCQAFGIPGRSPAPQLWFYVQVGDLRPVLVPRCDIEPCDTPTEDGIDLEEVEEIEVAA